MLKHNSSTFPTHLPCPKPSLSLLELKGVGQRILERLSKCGIKTLQDLLFHLPLRYEDRTRLSTINSLTAGAHGLIEGTIEFTEIVRKPRPTLVCRITDPTGSIDLRFFILIVRKKIF